MKRAIELIRVSTAGQAAEDRASIPAQRAINRRTALAYGLTIVRSIEMSDVSGAAVLLAPEIKELLALIEDTEIHGVIAREFSRLMRPENFLDYALLQAFADSNTVLYLPEGPIDFASKTGRLMGTIRAAIAGMERTEILERIWSAKEEKRRRGEFAQSRVCLPFGVDYDLSKGKDGWSYTPDAELVRECFRLVLAGETSFYAIGHQLGLKPFNVRNYLKNPIYTGWRVIDQRRDPSPGAKQYRKNARQGDRKKVNRAPDEIIRVQVIKEPLVSEADFELVQRILGMKQSFHWRTTAGYEQRYTYNGFLDCVCQGRVYTKNMRADYYVCKEKCGAKQMRRDKLDPYLDSIFANQLTRPSFLRRLARSRKSPTADVAQIKKQLESLTTKRDRVLDTYYEGMISATERDQKLSEVDREKQVFGDLLLRQEPARQFDAEQLARQFKVFAQFDILSRDQKRRILNTITPRIVVANYEVEGIACSVDLQSSDKPYGCGLPQYCKIYLPLHLKLKAA